MSEKIMATYLRIESQLMEVPESTALLHGRCNTLIQLFVNRQIQNRIENHTKIWDDNPTTQNIPEISKKG